MAKRKRNYNKSVLTQFLDLIQIVLNIYAVFSLLYLIVTEEVKYFLFRIFKYYLELFL